MGGKGGADAQSPSVSSQACVGMRLMDDKDTAAGLLEALGQRLLSLWRGHLIDAEIASDNGHYCWEPRTRFSHTQLPLSSLCGGYLSATGQASFGSFPQHGASSTSTRRGRDVGAGPCSCRQRWDCALFRDRG